MENADAYEIRRDNLNKLVLDKFKGNKSALSRAASVQVNHINLLLSENEAYRRNLGEKMARKIESELGLPTKWLDTPHNTVGATSLLTVNSPPIDVSLSGALRTCETIASISLTQAFVSKIERRVTAVENLLLATVDTRDMAPDLSDGDAVIIDTAVKAFSADGIYVVMPADQSAMLRKISRNAAGQIAISQSGEPPVALTADELKSLTLLARVIKVVRLDGI